LVTDPTGTHSYTYDEAGRLTAVDGQAYTWDNNGNLTGDGRWSYEYNSANRLRRVVSGTLTIVEYTYNGDGLDLSGSPPLRQLLARRSVSAGGWGGDVGRGGRRRGRLPGRPGVGHAAP